VERGRKLVGVATQKIGDEGLIAVTSLITTCATGRERHASHKPPNPRRCHREEGSRFHQEWAKENNLGRTES